MPCHTRDRRSPEAQQYRKLYKNCEPRGWGPLAGRPFPARPCDRQCGSRDRPPHTVDDRAQIGLAKGHFASRQVLAHSLTDDRVDIHSRTHSGPARSMAPRARSRSAIRAVSKGVPAVSGEHSALPPRYEAGKCWRYRITKQFVDHVRAQVRGHVVDILRRADGGDVDRHDAKPPALVR
jgi:hypothetical protein